MRVLFLSQHFPPEVGAPQTRVLETAKKLREFGHDVRVLTCFPNQPLGVVPPPYRRKLFMREEVEGVPTVRTWVWAAQNVGVLRRVANQGSFALSSLSGVPAAGPCDVMIVESPPLLLAAAGYTISRLKGTPFVFSVADLWPASAVDLGVLTNPVVVRAAEWLESFAYRKAARIVAVTEGIRNSLITGGQPAAKLRLIPNGADTDRFRAGPSDEGLAKRLGVQGGYVVLHAGTLGLAHGLGAALDAASLLRQERDVRFVLIGEGSDKRRLQEIAQRRRLTNVSFLPSQPRDEMTVIWNLADIALATLREGALFEGTLPAKMFEAMACERPVILAARGEAKGIMERARAGIVVDPGDGAGLAEAVLKLKADPERARELGRNGRAYVQQNHNRTELARRWEALLAEVAEER